MNNTYEISKNVEKLLNGKFTHFLDCRQQELIKRKIRKNYYDIYKPYIDSEKVIYYTNKVPKVLLYEIVSSKIIKHQDIMGTLFNLGIDPSMYGDILIIDDHYYIYIMQIIEKYLLCNLIKINNSMIKLEKRDINYLNDYRREYDAVEFIVSSERVDTVVARLIQSNRGSVLKKIQDKELLVNYDYPKGSYNLKKGDILSIRKYGKYKYDGVIKITKKRNMIIRLLKYI